jgi:putative SOS response-associated peptidase YedK
LFKLILARLQLRASPSLPIDLINSTSMCGRYTLRRDYERVRHELRVENGSGSIIFQPRYNVAPTDPVPILRLDENGQRQLSPMTWGIATPARDNKKRLTRHINARAESLASNALWRAALRETRCVVVSDGFYECSGPARASDRQPFFLHRADDALILMAGLWRWRNTDDGYLQEFTIVTTPANTTLAPIHDRMPAILEGDALSLWLNRKIDPDELPPLLEPARDDLLEARPVSREVNDVKNDGAELLNEWREPPQARKPEPPRQLGLLPDSRKQ